jgi:hypothetical protein
MKNAFPKLFLLVFLVWTPSLLSQQNRFYIYEKNDQFNVTPWFRYNKAEGLFTGVSSQFFFNENLFVEAKAGYAVAGKFPRYKAGIQKTFLSDNNEFFIRADYYDLTETHDPYVLPDWQNSVTALLFKLDYFNYYRARGPILTFGQNWNGTYKADVYVGMRDFYSLSNKAKLSLFDQGGERVNGKRKFAPNPPVAEGRDYYFGINYDIDFRPSPTAFVNAWQLKGRYENSKLLHTFSKSDFSYQRIYLEFDRYQRLFTKHKMLVTLKIASHEGRTSFTTDSLGHSRPQDQFLYDIGGYGSLRGYTYREFQNGNRMMTFSLDYFFNGSFLPKTFLTKIWGIGGIFKNTDLMLFADAGYVWNVDGKKSFLRPGRIGINDIKTDAGFGLAFTEWIRCEAAFPLRKGIDYAVYLRITPKF